MASVVWQVGLPTPVKSILSGGRTTAAGLLQTGGASSQSQKNIKSVQSVQVPSKNLIQQSVSGKTTKALKERPREGRRAAVHDVFINAIATYRVNKAVETKSSGDSVTSKAAYMVCGACLVLIAGRGKGYDYAIIGSMSRVAKVSQSTWDYYVLGTAINTCLWPRLSLTFARLSHELLRLGAGGDPERLMSTELSLPCSSAAMFFGKFDAVVVKTCGKALHNALLLDSVVTLYDQITNEHHSVSRCCCPGECLRSKILRHWTLLQTQLRNDRFEHDCSTSLLRRSAEVAAVRLLLIVCFLPVGAVDVGARGFPEYWPSLPAVGSTGI